MLRIQEHYIHRFHRSRIRFCGFHMPSLARLHGNIPPPQFLPPSNTIDETSPRLLHETWWVEGRSRGRWYDLFELPLPPAIFNMQPHNMLLRLWLKWDILFLIKSVTATDGIHRRETKEFNFPTLLICNHCHSLHTHRDSLYIIIIFIRILP